MNSEATTYNNIYKNTYWAAFNFELNRTNISKEIINNRNKLIEEYNINKRINSPP